MTSSSLHPPSLKIPFIASSIDPGPQTITIVSPPSAAPSGTSRSNNPLSTLPFPPTHPSPGLVSVCTTLHLPPALSTNASISPLSKISPSSRFPSSTTHSVPSPASSATALNT